MALQDIVDKIRQDAAAEAERIIEEARVKADSIINEAKLKSEQAKSAALDRARQKAEDVEKRLSTLAELEVRKELLGAKQSQIQHAFDKAIDNIRNMDDSRYLPWLRAMILKSAEPGEGILTVNAVDAKRINKAFLDDVNKELKKDGRGPLRLNQTPGKFLGGFTIKAGQVEINNTVDAALKLMRDEVEPLVAEILFKE